MLNPLSLTVIELKDGTVRAKTADGKIIELPKDALYGSPKAGQTIRLIGVAAGSEDLGQTAFAQRLLNELLALPHV